MMELPESDTLSRQINQHLAGKCISEVKALQSPHRFAFFKGDVEAYADMLEGQPISAACTRRVCQPDEQKSPG